MGGDRLGVPSVKRAAEFKTKEHLISMYDQLDSDLDLDASRLSLSNAFVMDDEEEGGGEGGERHFERLGMSRIHTTVLPEITVAGSGSSDGRDNAVTAAPSPSSAVPVPVSVPVPIPAPVPVPVPVSVPVPVPHHPCRGPRTRL